jgi:hypothetical protein
MAQLRAKQIKLVAADDLLIGGANGNGTVLSKGTAGQVLKVLAGGALGYEKAAAADTTVSAIDGLTATDVQSALAELADLAGTGTQGVQDELDAVETAVGLNADGTFTAITGSTHTAVNEAASVKAAIVAVDAALAAAETAYAAADTALDGRLDTVETDLATAKTDIDTLESDLAAEVTRATGVEEGLQDELDALEATVGSATDGTPSFYANGNFIVQGAAEIPEDASDPENVIPAVPAVTPDNHRVAIGKLDAALKAEETARTTAVSALGSELDATQAGAGLAVTGAYEAETLYNSETAPSGVHYISGATTLKSADKLLDAAIKTVADQVAAIAGDSSLADEVNAIETAVGLNSDGTIAAFTGDYVVGKTTFKAAVEALDVQTKTNTDDIADLVTQIQGITNLDALVFKGVVDGTITAEDLATMEATAEEGDVYRIATAGAAVFADQAFDVNIGDFVAYIGTGLWVKFDNTDPAIEAAAGETALVVSGNSYAGFELSITKNDVTSANDAITLTGGTAAVFGDGLELTFNAGNVNFSDLAETGTPAADGFLRWNTAGTGIEYVSAASLKTLLGVTIHAEEESAGAATANAEVTLANAPVAGSVSVFINGVKLKKTGFSVTGSVVALVDSVNGYAADESDTISVSYSYAA